MGCVQAKPSLTTPDRHGVESLKVEHGYIGGSHVPRPVGGPALVVRGEEEEEGAGAPRRAPPQQIERKMEDDLVDGWPRWLVSNVPRGVLDGLVPKRADS